MIEINSLYSVQYISSGLFESEQEWIHPKRNIDSYEIILVIDGEAYIQQEDMRYVLKKGDVLLLSPQKLHFGYQISKSKVSFYWLHFTTNFTEAFGISDFSHFDESYSILSLFRQLLHTANTHGYLPETVDLYVGLILCELEFKQSKQNNAAGHLSGQVIEWIRINSDRNITVMNVAQHFGYNENYISKLFKKSFQIGIKDFINEERIKLAKNLLLSTNYSVKQIANMLDYKEENLFIKFFNYHEMISPTKFRNTYFNTHMNNK